MNSIGRIGRGCVVGAIVGLAVVGAGPAAVGRVAPVDPAGPAVGVAAGHTLADGKVRQITDAIREVPHRGPALAAISAADEADRSALEGPAGTVGQIVVGLLAIGYAAGRRRSAPRLPA